MGSSQRWLSSRGHLRKGFHFWQALISDIMSPLHVCLLWLLLFLGGDRLCLLADEISTFIKSMLLTSFYMLPVSDRHGPWYPRLLVVRDMRNVSNIF